MNLIRKNFWSVYCKAFTIIVLLGAGMDVITSGKMNASQFNVFAIAVFSLIGVAGFSQLYRFDAISPLVSMIILYFILMVCVMLIVWLTGFMEPVALGGYRDALLSASIPYAIGAILYYLKLRREIKNQNKVIQAIQDMEGKCL